MIRKSGTLDVPRALALEDLYARRDRRHRANIAFAIRQLRTILLLILSVGSLMFGWPVSHAALEHLASLPALTR